MGFGWFSPIGVKLLAIMKSEGGDGNERAFLDVNSVVVDVFVTLTLHSVRWQVQCVGLGRRVDRDRQIRPVIEEDRKREWSRKPKKNEKNKLTSSSIFAMT